MTTKTITTSIGIDLSAKEVAAGPIFKEIQEYVDTLTAVRPKIDVTEKLTLISLKYGEYITDIKVIEDE